MRKAYSPRINRAIMRFTALGIFSALVAGCGGGGGGTTSTPPPAQPAGDFSISVIPTSLSIEGGASQTVTISVTEVNTYTASVNVSVSGLPAGVTASPATFSLTPGNQQQVKITVAATALTGTATLTFQGASGSLSHNAQTTLSISAVVTGSHAPIRTRYLRTNSFYDPDSLQYSPPHFTAYDAAHKQFFVSNPYMNEIDVFSATQETQIATIPVPMAWGIDVSPYNGSLYAGTFIGDIYQIDTSTLSVTNRYPAASIGPDGFAAQTTLVLSDGRLAVQGGAGGILGVDGFGVVAVWNPLTNALDTGTNGSVCNVGGEGTIAVSGDRTRILVTWVDTSGSAPVCSYNPVTQVATYGSLPTPNGSPVCAIAPTPDGTRFFLTTNLQGVAVFDAKTVQLLGQISGGTDYTQLPSGASSAVVSLDGKTLYLNNQSTSLVGAYDTNSLVQTGWIPNFTVSDSQSQIIISAIDETGLIVGPIGHGVGFIDASAPTTGTSSIAGTIVSISVNTTSITPDTGPISGDTQIQAGTNLGGPWATSIPKVSTLYVGNVPASMVSEVQKAADAALYIDGTTPPAAETGAVDLTSDFADGTVAIGPESFSYGPTILEVVPNGATAEGGQTGTIIGYGFGSTTSGVQVTVDGKSAPVTVVYNFPPISPYPFPTNSLQFTIPPGTAGAAVDVTVTTPSGSATAAGAFHYTAATQSFPLTANLQAGLYDAGRDLYYFTDQKQIQILSKSTGKWLSPISLPGVSSNTQLLAISESTDGTQLAVSDYGGKAIYVLNPANPTAVSRYSLQNAPAGLAVMDSGNVYFAAAGGNGFFELAAVSGAVIEIGLYYMEPGGEYVRVLQSSDGSRVYASMEGATLWVDTSNNQTHYATIPLLSGSFPELAISGDGSVVDVQGYLTDSALNVETVSAYIDWETWFPTAVNGQKLNQDGSILFQPLTDGIDLIARNTGRLLYRIQIPVTTANVYDSLVVAEGQNTLAVITATGVSFVDLSSLPIAAQYTTPFSAATHSIATRLADRQTISPVMSATSNRSLSLSKWPRLRSRLEQSKVYVKTP